MSELDEVRYPSGCAVVSGGLIAGNDTVSGGASGGLSRGSAIAGGGMWMGVSELPAGYRSNPHHHEGQTTMVCVISGSMDFIVTVPNGDEERFNVGPGQIALVPGGLVHREENNGDQGCLSVVVRNSEHPTVVNLTESA
ncbi:MAG: cupin domain-containing protein [Actinomycetota bacterium]|nr:cupin domain-containing protein [Actinomycetota bacterium]